MMMKRATLTIVSLCCVFGDVASADANNLIRNSQRIVVITEAEGIHYAHGCGFYELRDLLADGSMASIESNDGFGDALYEIRLLGKNGETVAQLGDHWINIESTVSLISASAYARVVELIRKREGQGVGKARIESSISSALTEIRSPTYVEENRCASR